MSTTFSTSGTETFSITHARKLAAKVSTDLQRMQRFYNVPSDKDIVDYETEVVELLRGGYLGTVTYGFRKDEKWIEPTLRYTAQELSGDSVDDDPGKLRPGADTSGASFYSFLTYSSKWSSASSEERKKVEGSLPFTRSAATEPGVKGYFVQDRTYSSGGRSLVRMRVNS